MNKMDILEIDPDIKKAETLSSDFYTDEKYFEASKEKIFARSWQLVGLKSSVQNLFPHILLKGFLDEPILVTLDQTDNLRCLSNVCTHRGKILVESNCKSEGIKCAYHGRTFSLDGKFRSMPEFEEAVDFPAEKDDLPEVAFDTWNDFLFASLNPYAPLADFIDEILSATADFNFTDLNFVSHKDYMIKSHWALYCENYLEGFHIPFVHKSLNREIDYGCYTTELFRFSSLQTGLDESGQTAARYFFVFPNLMFNLYEWGISVNIVVPQEEELTKVSYMTLVNDETKIGQGAGADLETVEFEDQAVVESVQTGINSRFYDRGRYSPTREKGTHHFHRLICEFMRNRA
jgi:choline monooxygenase